MRNFGAAPLAMPSWLNGTDSGCMLPAMSTPRVSITWSPTPVLHGDNGATLKATAVLAMLHWLGIKPSYSRPRVSNDNAYAETLFRTAKYRPESPAQGFASLQEACA